MKILVAQSTMPEYLSPDCSRTLTMSNCGRRVPCGGEREPMGAEEEDGGEAREVEG